MVLQDDEGSKSRVQELAERYPEGYLVAEIDIGQNLLNQLTRQGQKDGNVKRTLARQWTGPRFDPDDIVEIQFDHGLQGVKAHVVVRRGHRILGEYVRRHIAGGIRIVQPTDDHSVVEISGDGGTIRLAQGSVGGVFD